MNKPRTIHGRGRYSDIVWKSLILDEPFMGYARVDFMYYRIQPDELRFENLKDAVRDEFTPDLDEKGSGNIHPSKARVRLANEKGEVQQLVLMHRVNSKAPWGPALGKGQTCDGKKYEFYNAIVPAANYYPPIEPIENPNQEETQKQEFLKNIAKSFDCPAL